MLLQKSDIYCNETELKRSHIILSQRNLIKPLAEHQQHKTSGRTASTAYKDLYAIHYANRMDLDATEMKYIESISGHKEYF